MTTTIQKVAIFGASGNFGTPITAALQRAGFNITIITRTESSSTFPAGLPVIRTSYTLENLTTALAGQDAAICVVGPGGIGAQVTMIEAAEAAGVKRFIVDDFGWGPDFRNLPEFRAIHAHRRAGWELARAKAEANPNFTFTGITSGNPIDWAMKRFPLMGFDIAQCSALIYDSGTEKFTATTLAGIGQSVVGVLQHPDETANRFVKVLSLITNQTELLEAFQRVTGRQWPVQRASAQTLIESGQRKFQAGMGGWVLELVVAQMYDEGQARCVMAPSWEASDSPLLGVKNESADEVVAKVLQM
ncbi:NAD(P)-binding protein [Aspergillus heteromorphus CBS 117.55]|uniref:NAD(P)-binding protein n=1 Tax=Aspergillus heteromorphus CBS 117.55 TaxID=1448321 RepID=A0A317UVP8_9EURO|nr:NAD(P)-binding protein [Aspergillus heteromorphus CBS 117.55]PWY66104.1 NAD(P)-binding protein [Aspergillus heteromorphus CBS 117.55]